MVGGSDRRAPARWRSWLPCAGGGRRPISPARCRSEEHTSELQSLMRISYAVFCLKKKTNTRRRQQLASPDSPEYEPPASIPSAYDTDDPVWSSHDLKLQ